MGARGLVTGRERRPWGLEVQPGMGTGKSRSGTWAGRTRGDMGEAEAG
jgi:hypothetical protein